METTQKARGIEMTEQTPKEKAIEHIMYNGNNKTYFPIKDLNCSLYIKISEGIDIALSELQKQHEAKIRIMNKQHGVK